MFSDLLIIEDIGDMNLIFQSQFQKKNVEIKQILNEINMLNSLL